MTNQEHPNIFVAWVSVVSNIMLTLLKLIIGFLFHSQVLVADGVHNAGDVVASLASLSSMKISKQPADEDHPYGHGKAEVIASFIVAILMAFAALVIAYQSLLVLFEPSQSVHWITIVAAMISLLWKQALYLYTIRAGRRENSKGLIAIAYDHLADVYSSAAAVIGISIAFWGDFLNLSWAVYGDPIAGIVVAFLVMKLALKMGYESIEILMEKNVAPEKIEHYITLISTVPHVVQINRIRAREHGHYVLVDVRVSIPGDFTVKRGHDISKEIKQLLMRNYSEINEVFVHINPWFDSENP